MHLEKPLAFLQPERERENAFGHAWELRNLDGEFFLVRKRRVEISSLACSFLSTDNLSRLLVTRVLSFFDRVAANAPSFFFSLSIAEDTVFSRADHVHHARRLLALQPIWRTSWLATGATGRRRRSEFFGLVGFVRNFDGRFDRQGIQEYTLNTRRDGFKRVLLDWKKKKKKEENERIPEELINRTN